MSDDNALPLSGLVALLDRNEPGALRELRARFPEVDLRPDRQLGDGPTGATSEAVIAVATAALSNSSAVADKVRAFVRRRMLLYSRLTLMGNLIGAGSALGLFATISSDVHRFEIVAASSAFAGSMVALLAQYVENTSHGGVSIKDALARLVDISRDLAEAKGLMEMFRAMGAADSTDLEAIVRRASQASAELVALQISLNVPA